MDDKKLEKLVALCKRRGFIYPGSEIYGGLSGTWDYGPMGSLLKKNIKDVWWKDIVQLRDDVVGLDGAILMNPQVWVASGHVDAFTDPLVECKSCHLRFRADKEEEILDHQNSHNDTKIEWTTPQKFNLLVKSYLGVVEGAQLEVFLRGEITQGVMANFKNVIDSTRVKPPFGIAQIGKAFRNEITPGNFTFRSREFEQMELQYFIKPEVEAGRICFEYWKKFWMDWYLGLGINKDNLRFKDHEDGERAHYAVAATDLEYQAPWGWAEVLGVHHRGDLDLKQHQQHSGQNLQYTDSQSGISFLPWDIESSIGVDRTALFILLDSYRESEGRVFLKLHPKLAPLKAAVFPLLPNKPELVEKARQVYLDLKSEMMVGWDDRGNIGKRYASQDEVGTPFCLTVDFQSLEDNTLTVRDRDTGTQERLKIDSLKDYLSTKING